MQMTLLKVVRSSFILNLFISLAVLTASGVVNPAAGQTTILFDFETAPDIAVGTNNFDPVFIDPVSGFTLSHDPGPVDGNAQWADDGGKCIPRAGAGCVRLSDDGTDAVPVMTTINFSGPVSSITLWAANFFTTASITPILAAGATLPAIPVPATGMGTGEPEDPFTVTYSEFNIVGSGPYIGLEMNALVANQLSWDDLEVTLTLIEADWKVSGDGLITLDTGTGLQWLDLTETTDMTVVDVSAEFGSGGDFEGFRYATATEVGEFYTDAGLSGFATDANTVSGNFIAAQIAAAEALQALWGVTEITDVAEQDLDRSLGFIDEPLGEGAHRLATLEVFTEAPQSWTAGTRGSSAGSASQERGSALVRPPRGETSARDVPTPTGEDIVVLDIEAFQQVASKVIVAGSTDADFCVAPDIREIVKNNGRQHYTSRPLALAELSGLGSCTGLLVPEETDTWENLLSQIDLVIAPWYRSYEGEFETVSGHWFVIGVVRTSAEYEGPVGIVGFPETLIDFTDELECDADLDMRPLDLGGAVAAFGEVANIEGNRMIVETAQCNRSKGLTRRTTHVYPIRLDGKARVERINVQWQLNGIEDTLTEADGCILDGSPITMMRLDLATAREAFAQGRFDDAIDDLEDIARIAKDADFTNCPIAANYSGNLMSRGLTAAFTVWDRFWLADQGLPWTIYLIPFDLEVPVLTPTTP